MNGFMVWLPVVCVASADFAYATQASCSRTTRGPSFCALNSACLGNFERLESSTCNPFEDIKFGNSTAPAFLDFDGDGDLDLVLGNADGKLMYYEHRGIHTLSLDVVNLNPFKDVEVGSHAVPTFGDWDGDHDLDLAVGNATGHVWYYEQLENRTFSRRIGTPMDGVVVDRHAAPAFVDWDGDEDLDLVVGKALGDVQYYQRTGDNTLLWQRDVGNPFNFLHGTRLSPEFADWNGDGKVDLVLAKHDKGVRYYERIAYNSVFVSQFDSNPMKAVSLNSFHGKAAIGDWDGDDDLDLVVGQDSGELQYYERVRTTTISEFFVERTDFASPCRGINDAGWAAHPVFVDLAGNGVSDLVVGNGNGVLKYYKQVDHKLLLATDQQNPFIDIGVGQWAVPAFADWDGDDNLDLAVGNFQGKLKCYQRAHNNPSFVLQTDYANPCQGIDVGRRAAPAFLDFDEDGDQDLVLGSEDGQLKYFECIDNVTWSPRLGTAFDDVGKGHNGFTETVPAFVDLDGDRDLDLLVGIRWGAPLYYERIDNTWKDWKGQNPFIHLKGFNLRAALTDWDGDGDLDIVAGFGDGILRFFLNGCEPAMSCTSRGQCIQAGQCQCLDGYRGAAHCGLCSPGFEVQNPEGELFCTRCSPGRFHPGDVSPTCRPCLPGEYAARGSSFCSICAGGAVPDSNQSSCLESEAGKYASTGMDSCISCPLGKYATSGSSSCMNCSAGSFPSLNQRSCLECEAGRHASTGMESCNICQRGKYAEGGSSACSNCLAGSVPSNDRSSCLECAAGEYASAGMDTCVSCPIGRDSSSASASCDWDVWLMFWMVLCGSIQFYASYIPFRYMKRRMRLVDVSPSADSVAITTWHRHLLENRICAYLSVDILGTGHPYLDAKRFKVRALDSYRLELLDEASNKIIKDIHTSKGIVVLPLLAAYLAVGRNYPAHIVLLPIPWLITLWAQQLLLPITIISCGICATISGLIFKRQHTRSLTPLQVRHKMYKKLLLKQNPNPVRCDPGPGRAVTLEKIKNIFDFFHDFIRDRNAYYLVSNIVLPITNNAKLSFAECIGPSPVDYFVSHFWGTSFAHFVEALDRHAKSHRDATILTLAYWVCFLSNNQWHLDEEIMGGWQESSFYKALRSASCLGTCMVLDNWALPLTRAWCLFEVLQTFKRQENQDLSDRFEGLTFITEKGVLGTPQDREGEQVYDVAICLADRLAKLDVRNATATQESDEVMIKSVIEENGGMDNMNHFIRVNMGEALAEVQREFSQRTLTLRKELRPSLGLLIDDELSSDFHCRDQCDHHKFHL